MHKIWNIFFGCFNCSFCLNVFRPVGKPQIIEKTDNSVTITWSRSTKIGQSSLLGYTVEMYGRNDTDGWVSVVQRIQETTYTHTDLTAGISYYFVVRAENTHGMSAPSAISEPVIVGIVSIFCVCFFFVNILHAFSFWRTFSVWKQHKTLWKFYQIRSFLSEN